jgi:hypothetical protein
MMFAVWAAILLATVAAAAIVFWRAQPAVHGSPFPELRETPEEDLWARPARGKPTASSADIERRNGHAADLPPEALAAGWEPSERD